VEAGLTAVEPLEDVDVKLPGVMLTPVAPVTFQLSVLLAPGLTLGGFAVKEVIDGAPTGVVGAVTGAAPPPPLVLFPVLPQPPAPNIANARLRSATGNLAAVVRGVALRSGMANQFTNQVPAFTTVLKYRIGRGTWAQLHRFEHSAQRVTSGLLGAPYGLSGEALPCTKHLILGGLSDKSGGSPKGYSQGTFLLSL
jgi:hypothetical protein